MARWLCRPSLYSKNESIPVYYGNNVIGMIPIGMEIVGIDTENLQESLYSAFNDSGWKNGEKLGIKKTDKFSVKEDEKTFEIYVNEKFVATFCKDREIKW